jgi:hypothetical protein
MTDRSERVVQSVKHGTAYNAHVPHASADEPPPGGTNYMSGTSPGNATGPSYDSAAAPEGPPAYGYGVSQDLKPAGQAPSGQPSVAAI